MQTGWKPAKKHSVRDDRLKEPRCSWRVSLLIVDDESPAWPDKDAIISKVLGLGFRD